MIQIFKLFGYFLENVVHLRVHILQCISSTLIILRFIIKGGLPVSVLIA